MLNFLRRRLFGPDALMSKVEAIEIAKTEALLRKLDPLKPDSFRAEYDRRSRRWQVSALTMADDIFKGYSQDKQEQICSLPLAWVFILNDATGSVLDVRSQLPFPAIYDHWSETERLRQSHIRAGLPVDEIPVR